MSVELLKIKNFMQKDGATFFYHGKFSQVLLVKIGHDLRSRIKGETNDRTLSIKVFSVFIELIQNVIRYAETGNPPEMDQEDNGNQVGVIVLGQNNGHYFIACGNEINIDKKKIMEARLDKIKNMSKDELKAYFNEQRKKTPEATSKGGGIGLIEIAKLASQPIEYDITDVGDDRYFYSLTVTI